MNTQAVKDELLEFVYANFNNEESDILEELTDIFIQSHVSAIHNSVIRTTHGLILNLDLVINFMNAKRQRADIYQAIAGNLHPSLLSENVPPQKGGVTNRRCNLVFKSFEAFLHACLALKTKRHKALVAFSVKCTSMVVRLYAAIREDLKKTQAALAEEKAQVNRRLFLVIKNAVCEYRRENGYPFTDSDWRIKNFGNCCRRLSGITYRLGATPYVQKDFVENAHSAIKHYYKLCKENQAPDQPKYTQLTMRQYYDLVLGLT